MSSSIITIKSNYYKIQHVSKTMNTELAKYVSFIVLQQFVLKHVTSKNKIVVVGGNKHGTSKCFIFMLNINDLVAFNESKVFPTIVPQVFH